MFEFSGKVTQAQWWRAIAVIFPLCVVCVSIGQNVHTRYGFVELFAWIVDLAACISCMGWTVRRLRDAGKSRGQIIAYCWLTLLPFTAPFAMIYYFFVAGFTPSRLSPEEQEAERLKQAEADAEYRRRQKEAELRRQAEAWAREDESRSYNAGEDRPNGGGDRQSERAKFLTGK